ncbi:hypothetical protein [Isoptericola sp. BMS4]|nr:hypothetical protein [Isoptericola sp. BMS4]
MVDGEDAGDAGLGGFLEFRFPDGGFDMEVIQLRPRQRVVWREPV